MTTLCLADLAARFGAPLPAGSRVWHVAQNRPATVISAEALGFSGLRFVYRLAVGPGVETFVALDSELLALPPRHPDIRPLAGRWPACGVVDGGGAP